MIQKTREGRAKFESDVSLNHGIAAGIVLSFKEYVNQAIPGHWVNDDASSNHD